ncbi:PH domain-containing protein [Acetobacterium bakii]|uniref:Uncharacterized protein n=1 Tax=Acetobacterium bakii TaxID=52689 RepID=A0A0L6U4A6_9FIRM|nr:PH domain-containing protein [Acetobacterium bakii]KNZ43187.1 hypothetical protein AKG39_03320 [Acetobacterium bakii]
MNYFISILSSFNPLFFVLFVLALVIIGKAIFTFKSFPELRGKAIREMVVGGFFSILILGLFVVVPLISGITIKNNELSLRLPSGMTFVTYTGDTVLSATLIDIETQPQYAIKSKVVGTEMRNYREGIFKLENGTEAQVFLNGTKAIYVETTGTPLILGPDHFDQFLKSFSENIKPIQ